MLPGGTGEEFAVVYTYACAAHWCYQEAQERSLLLYIPMPVLHTGATRRHRRGVCCCIYLCLCCTLVLPGGTGEEFAVVYTYACAAHWCYQEAQERSLLLYIPMPVLHTGATRRHRRGVCCCIYLCLCCTLVLPGGTGEEFAVVYTYACAAHWCYQEAQERSLLLYVPMPVLHTGATRRHRRGVCCCIYLCLCTLEVPGGTGEEFAVVYTYACAHWRYQEAQERSLLLYIPMPVLHTGATRRHRRGVCCCIYLCLCSTLVVPGGTGEEFAVVYTYACAAHWCYQEAQERSLLLYIHMPVLHTGGTRRHRRGVCCCIYLCLCTLVLPGGTGEEFAVVYTYACDAHWCYQEAQERSLLLYIPMPVLHTGATRRHRRGVCCCIYLCLCCTLVLPGGTGEEFAVVYTYACAAHWCYQEAQERIYLCLLYIPMPVYTGGTRRHRRGVCCCIYLCLCTLEVPGGTGEELAVVYTYACAAHWCYQEAQERSLLLYIPMPVLHTGGTRRHRRGVCCCIYLCLCCTLVLPGGTGEEFAVVYTYACAVHWCYQEAQERSLLLYIPMPVLHTGATRRHRRGACCCMYLCLCCTLVLPGGTGEEFAVVYTYACAAHWCYQEAQERSLLLYIPMPVLHTGATRRHRRGVCCCIYLCLCCTLVVPGGTGEEFAVVYTYACAAHWWYQEAQERSLLLYIPMPVHTGATRRHRRGVCCCIYLCLCCTLVLPGGTGEEFAVVYTYACAVHWRYQEAQERSLLLYIPIPVLYTGATRRHRRGVCCCIYLCLCCTLVLPGGTGEEFAVVYTYACAAHWWYQEAQERSLLLYIPMPVLHTGATRRHRRGVCCCIYLCLCCTLVLPGGTGEKFAVVYTYACAAHWCYQEAQERSLLLYIPMPVYTGGTRRHRRGVCCCIYLCLCTLVLPGGTGEEFAVVYTYACAHWCYQEAQERSLLLYIPMPVHTGATRRHRRGVCCCIYLCLCCTLVLPGGTGEELAVVYTYACAAHWCYQEAQERSLLLYIPMPVLHTGATRRHRRGACCCIYLCLCCTLVGPGGTGEEFAVVYTYACVVHWCYQEAQERSLLLYIPMPVYTGGTRRHRRGVCCCIYLCLCCTLVLPGGTGEELAVVYTYACAAHWCYQEAQERSLLLYVPMPVLYTGATRRHRRGACCCMYLCLCCTLVLPGGTGEEFAVVYTYACAAHWCYQEAQERSLLLYIPMPVLHTGATRRHRRGVCCCMYLCLCCTLVLPGGTGEEFAVVYTYACAAHWCYQEAQERSLLLYIPMPVLHTGATRRHRRGVCCCIYLCLCCTLVVPGGTGEEFAVVYTYACAAHWCYQESQERSLLLYVPMPVLYTGATRRHRRGVCCCIYLCLCTLEVPGGTGCIYLPGGGTGEEFAVVYTYACAAHWCYQEAQERSLLLYIPMPVLHTGATRRHRRGVCCCIYLCLCCTLVVPGGTGEEFAVVYTYACAAHWCYQEAQERSLLLYIPMPVLHTGATRRHRRGVCCCIYLCLCCTLVLPGGTGEEFAVVYTYACAAHWCYQEAQERSLLLYIPMPVLHTGATRRHRRGVCCCIYLCLCCTLVLPGGTGEEFAVVYTYACAAHWCYQEAQERSLLLYIPMPVLHTGATRRHRRGVCCCIYLCLCCTLVLPGGTGEEFAVVYTYACAAHWCYQEAQERSLLLYIPMPVLHTGATRRHRRGVCCCIYLCLCCTLVLPGGTGEEFAVVYTYACAAHWCYQEAQERSLLC